MLEKGCSECWVDFSPQHTTDSYGHYVPLHLAFADACSKSSFDYFLIGKTFSLDTFAIDNTNFTKGPGYFGFKKVFKIKKFFDNLSYSKINLIIYEGNFLLYLFFAFVLKISTQKLTLHFNWSNDKQLNKMINRHRQLLKLYFSALSRSHLHSIISYVENPHLLQKLNEISNFKFKLFPTPSVFNETENIQEIPSSKKILIFVNDPENEKDWLKRIVSASNLTKFDDFEIHIFGIRDFESFVGNKITLHKFQQISLKEYGSLIGQSSDILLIYNSNNYETLTSGRFLDAIVFKRPIWVPKQFSQLDWMGNTFKNLHKFDLLAPNWLDEIIGKNFEFEVIDKNYLPNSSNMLRILNHFAKELPKIKSKKGYLLLLFLYFTEHARFVVYILKNLSLKDIFGEKTTN